MRTWLHSLVVWSLIHFWTDQRQNWCSQSIASLPQQALKLNNFTATTCIFKSIQTKQYIFQFWLPDFFFLHSFTSLSSSTRFSSKSSSDNWAMFTSSRAEWTAVTELFSLDRKSLNGTSSSFWSKTIFFQYLFFQGHGLKCCPPALSVGTGDRWSKTNEIKEMHYCSKTRWTKYKSKTSDSFVTKTHKKDPLSR